MTKRDNNPRSHRGTRLHRGASGNIVVAGFASLAVASLALSGFAATRSPAEAEEVASIASPASEASCSGAGTIWWSELLAPETQKLSEFYASVIGWQPKFVDVENQTQPASTPENRYTIFTKDGDDIAGLMNANHPDAVQSGVGWFTYIQVADVDAAVAKVQAGGGSVLRQAAETSDGHKIAVVRDPMGNAFGLVTPAKTGPC